MRVLMIFFALIVALGSSASVRSEPYVQTVCPYGISLGCWEVDKSSIEKRGEYIRYWQRRGTYGMSSDIILSFQYFNSWIEVDCKLNRYRIVKYVLIPRDGSPIVEDGEMIWTYGDPNQAFGVEIRAICDSVK
jgi:hypothetical protein